MMQTRFLLVALAAFAIPALAYHYNDYVLTTMKMETRQKIDDYTTQVHFDSNTKGGDKAVFLTNITKIGTNNGIDKFEAYVISPAIVRGRIKAKMFMNMVNHTLLAIHGFNVNFTDHLKECKDVTSGDKKSFYLLPIIWPSDGKLYRYWWDRGHSKKAGEALKECIALLGDKWSCVSLIAHSMGNRVLKYAASEKIHLDNIFMVAADVNADIFLKNAGEEIGSMVDINSSTNKQQGKIHVVYNEKDKALKWSSFINRKRLGKQELKQEKILPKLQGMVVSEKKWDTPDELKKDKEHDHSYQWEKAGIEFYEKKMHNP